jgi:hypothetical protein
MKKKNKFEKMKERIEKERDPDTKRELKKGNIVEIIGNGLNY